MPDSLTESLLRKLAALWCAVMIVVSLAAISVVRADHKRTTTVNAASTGAGNNPIADTSGDTGGPAPGEPSASDLSNGATSAVGGPAAAAGGGNAARSTAASTPGAAPKIAPSTGTNCPDYNPAQGVFCDHYVIGGTTVLSGPLAQYGEAGLKAGQSWITYYNTEIAPKEGLRKVKLVWYDDNLDPNKTLQYTQRMNEIDHILYIAGVTSPEAIDPYLRDAPCVSRVGKQDCPGGASKGLPFIGDFGLSPKSYTNPMIFPVIPNYETTIALLTKAAFEDFHMKTFSVIWGTLPGVDTTPIRGWWEGAAKRFGIKMLAYRDMASTDSDCSAQWGAATTDKPEFVFVPVATGAMLACLRAAKQNGQQPNTPGSPWLKGWFGGSGLQVEVDNCAPTCEGMLASTVFRDARTYNTPPMDAYRRNMARYAPNVDITGFIPINYYHTGWVVYNLLKGAGITSNLTRKTLFDAANHFGPFETGFGDTITWTTQLPRTPTVCGYRIYARGDKWVYDDRKNCL